MARTGRTFAILTLQGCIALSACVGSDPVAVGDTTSDGGNGGAEGGGGAGGDGGGPVNNVDGPNKPCKVATDCAGGLCVDGFCCNRACGEPCEACNLPGKEGTCSLATGSPVGSRSACVGTGSCTGSCNGTSPQCAYPDKSVVCGAACDGTCDGAGGCTSVAGGSCPGGFACGQSSCKTSCAVKEDCQPFFECKGSACERVPESDCLDGKDNNGDGLADCADPTCAAVVECVPAAATGGELGLFQDPATCPANFETSQSWYAGLQGSACTGCSCTTNCTATVTIWSSDNNCGSGGTARTFTGPPTGGSTVTCQAVPATTYVRSTTTTPTIAGCTGTGTPTQAAPTWSTTKQFCAAKQTSTCADATKRCVAKRSAKLCARGNATDACPTGYADDRGTFYSSYTPGSCTGSCSSCNPATAMTCKHQLLTPQVYTGTGCTVAGDFVDTSCGGLSRGTYRGIGAIFVKDGTDNCTNNVTTVPPTPSGATRVCCAP